MINSKMDARAAALKLAVELLKNEDTHSVSRTTDYASRFYDFIVRDVEDKKSIPPYLDYERKNLR